MSGADSLPAVVTGGAFLLGVVFGAVGQRVNFCTMGAVSDVATFGDWRRMRMWVLAIVVAIAGVALLQAAGLIDVAKSIYTGPRIAWLSMIVGGFLFGFGMTLGSGCGSKSLIRLGGGNLKSLIVLVFLGIAAYMTLKGLFVVWRATGLDPFVSTWVPQLPTFPRCWSKWACLLLPKRGCRGSSLPRSRHGSSQTAHSARRAR